MTTAALKEIEVASPRRRWPKYPRYLSSDLLWLPSVPGYWQVKPIGHLVKVRGGCTPSKENLAYWNGEHPWVTPKDMKCDVIRDAIDHISELALRETGASIIAPAAVLIVVRGMILAHTFPVALTAAPVTINQDMKALLPRSEITAEYLAWVLRGLACAVFTIVEESGHGTRVLRTDLWKRFLVPVPPLDEQRAIAAFLDRETAKIDELIVRKQRLIELIKEKRQANISRAVTKGLDPNAGMKPSGIDWLGDVPAHWTMKRLKHVADLQTGLTLGKRYAENVELRSRPYLRVANVQDGFLDLSDITTVQVPPDDISRYELRAGDVLMTEGGDFDKLGRGYVWDGQIDGCLHQNHIFAVRPNPNCLDSQLLAMFLVSSHGRNYFTSTSQQTTNLASTNSKKLKEFPIPLPPKAEQLRLIESVNRLCKNLDEASNTVQVAVCKLREHRSALITAAVTGQIDVRKELPNA